MTRASMDPRDPAHDKEVLMRIDGVRFNGERLARATCFMADEEKGEVLVYTLGHDGTPMADPADPTRYLLTRKRGKVEIIWLPGAAPQ